MKNVAELTDLIGLERIEDNLFRGQSYRTQWGRVYGGQVLAQALHAANLTVSEDRMAHSMHGYFILAGDIDLPIIYEVDRIRDGGSFATRRVKAIQKGRAIFNMSASFQIREEGIEHQIDMPNVPGPDALLSDVELAESFKDTLPDLYKRYRTPRPIEFKPVERVDFLDPHPHLPRRHVWIRAKGDIGDSFRLHQEIFVFASDYNLLTTAILPHQDIVRFDQLMLASLDHAIWFHREFRMDEWLLLALESPVAGNARGFTRGTLFNTQGQLVASVVQEGLIRVKHEQPRQQ